jgi:hypothetical protein
MTETDKKTNSIPRIIQLFNQIETTPGKKEENFEAIKEIVDNILTKKGMNELTDRREFAGELEIIYNAVIQSNSELKEWAEEFFLLNYEKESKFFLPDDYEGADYGGGKRKSKKSKKSKKSYNKKGKSRKSKKSRKSYNKKGKSRKSRKSRK